MKTDLNNLKPGYYWHTMDKDPLTVIHIHDDGGATLMGTDFRMGPQAVANMIQQGERFFWNRTAGALIAYRLGTWLLLVESVKHRSDSLRLASNHPAV